MEKTNGYLKGKSYGFYVTLVLTALTVVTAVIYAALYNGSRYMSWPTVWIMIAGAAIALALPLAGQARWSNAVLALADFVAFLLYVYYIYFYVSVVMVGIQAKTFSWQFILCTVLFAALLVLNIVNVFLKQVRE